MPSSFSAGFTLDHIQCWRAYVWKLFLLRNWKQPENGAFHGLTPSLIMMIGQLCSNSCFDNVMRGNGDKRSNQATSWPTQPSPSIWHFIKTTNTAQLLWDFERVDCLRFLSVKSYTCVVPFSETLPTTISHLFVCFHNAPLLYSKGSPKKTDILP